MNGVNSVLEESIRLHAHNFGIEKAYDLAYSAGVSVTEQGKVALMLDDPFVVMLRMARLFTLDGKMAGLQSCLPLLAKLQHLATLPEYADVASFDWPSGILGGSGADQFQFEPRIKA